MKIKLFPIIAVGLLFFAWICTLIGMGGWESGWASNDDCDFGWKAVSCSRGASFDYDDDTDAKKGGDAAIAGSVLSFIFLMVAMGLCGVCIFGLGPGFLSFAGAGLNFFIAIIWMICWAAWAGITDEDRDDADADPSWAFAFAIIGTIFTAIAGGLMATSPFFDITLKE
ncbi:hypothetical protein QOT17_013631 [Balamuthia mandrillaris]